MGPDTDYPAASETRGSNAIDEIVQVMRSFEARTGSRPLTLLIPARRAEQLMAELRATALLTTRGSSDEGHALEKLLGMDARLSMGRSFVVK